MVQTLLSQGVRQRLHDVLLPHQFFKRMGPIFPRKDEIAHGGAFYGGLESA